MSARRKKAAGSAAVPDTSATRSPWYSLPDYIRRRIRAVRSTSRSRMHKMIAGRPPQGARSPRRRAPF